MAKVFEEGSQKILPLPKDRGEKKLNKIRNYIYRFIHQWAIIVLLRMCKEFIDLLNQWVQLK